MGDHTDTWYTGCAIERDWDLGTLDVTQKAFTESMLNRFSVNSSSDIPATPGVEVGPREEDEPKGGWPYREAVGSLMRLATMTRPEVSNAERAVTLSTAEAEFVTVGKGVKEALTRCFCFRPGERASCAVSRLGKQPSCATSGSKHN